MADHTDSFLRPEQRFRKVIHENNGPTNFITNSGLRKVLQEHAEDIDKYVPRVMGVVFGGLAASGAAAGTFGLAAVAGGAAGYAVGNKMGQVVTGKVRAFLKETLDEAAAAENSSDSK